ncbi:MAG: CPBP family intramembrane metalloprotease [Cyclobacteriaceae bacterium]|nr:CPBP family intramembrane metalloprotease [Cyclobacteriaceae bacterium]
MHKINAFVEMSELTGISNRHPLLSVIFILFTMAIGFIVIGPLLGFLIALPFYDGSLFELTEKISDPINNPEIRLALVIIQGSATLFGLILIPALYLLSMERVNPVQWLTSKTTSGLIILVTTGLVLSFMATNSVFIEWNSTFVFPEFLKDFEHWAREREDLAEKLTKFFVTFDSDGEFLLGVFVIAFLPAIGEELVFRGMLQPELYRATGNHHAAVWISAIIFSAFHMQFFGFVPRLFLGALFGYLYVWSGNLLLPMVAHFVNNGFSVLMMYLYQKGTIPIDMEAPEAAPWPLVLIFTALFCALLYYFKKYHQSTNPTAV